MKRGELTSGQIVLLILALAAFIVLGLFLWSLNTIADGGEQACKLSVLTRASLPLAGGTKDTVPLSCAVQKICLSAGGNCAESMAGEEIMKIKLPSDATKAARTIEETAAEAMYNCWTMMGKGQLDITTGYWASRGIGLTDSSVSKPVCVICSRIALDKKLNSNKSAGEILSKVNFKRYMETTTVPGTSLTYLQVFSDKEVDAFSVVDKPLNQVPDSYDADGKAVKELSSNGAQFAIVFMQIRSPTWDSALQSIGDDLLTGTTALAGGSFYLNKVGTIQTGYRLLTWVGKNWRVASLAIGLATEFTLINSYINTKASQELAAGYCGSYARTGDTSQGCSIVQAVPYDAKAINQLCGGNIEGVA